MADIELVIKISEKTYNALTHTEFDANLFVNEMRKSIVNGTPMGVYCDTCEIGTPCLYCKHEFKPQESEG